ncbi:MAG: AAA family ATPase [Cyanobacteria bacterium SIG31]|nr:AAA family ATPase [Cyanobacteria bacterium SIG31]
MRVQSINSYYNYNMNKPVRTVSVPAFKGIFDSYDSKAIEYFDYGLQALDENSLLIATPNREKTFFNLKQYKDKIDVPILKTYILDVTKDLDKDWGHSVSNGFAVFKKQNEYYILNLEHMGMHVYKGEYDPDTSILQSGEVRKLENGMRIDAFMAFGREPFLFKRPSEFNTRKAERFLSVQDTIDATAHNAVAISKITAPKTEGKTKSRIFTFADIGGLAHVIEDLRKFVIRPLAYPQVFENVRLNKGILLYGPPRCGKTLLGKALANEAGIDFKYMNANEFKSSHVGATEASIRDAFKELEGKPSILFIDEFDAIGKKRDGSSNARYDDATVNQLLGCMSDLEKSLTTSFVIAATNRKDLLDDALVASGRFGLQMEIPMPNENALEEIYKVHSKNQSFGEDVNIKEIVTAMLENKFNGSDVAEMFTIGFFNALERMGLNQKMDAKTFNYNDLKSIRVVKSDLFKAIKTITSQKI